MGLRYDELHSTTLEREVGVRRVAAYAKIQLTM